MFLELTALGILASQFIYHRWIEDHPTKEVKTEIKLPIVEVGRPIPKIYGRVRVRQPILAWHGTFSTERGDALNNSEDAPWIYRADMLFVLGIPFASGAGTSSVHNLWAGERRFDYIPPLATMQLELDSDGNPIEIFHGGQVEILDGNETQEIIDSGGSAVTQIGGSMLDDVNPMDPGDVPGYRGFLSVALYDPISDWSLGADIPGYSFEASSYGTNHAQLGTFARVGDDSNPVNAIFDMLTDPWGGLGIHESYIDISNFQQVQFTLHTESHGYSRCIESAEEAHEHIGEVLKQIDGVLRHNPVTDKLELKLIRPDFDPNAIPHITKANCVKLTNFAMSGWSNLNNRVRVVYPNRAKDYEDDDVIGPNQSNTSELGQGAKNLVVLDYRGVCTEPLANAIRTREIAARSRPLIKCRALVDRSFIRVLQGDAVKLTYTNPDVAGLIFRVADIDHGTLEDGVIALDLILDFNYTWRNETPQPPAGSEFGIDLLDLDLLP